MIRRFPVIAHVTVIMSLTALCLIASHRTAKAEVPAAQQTRLVRDINTARHDYLQARLELHEWILGNLRKLDQQGHATWLELARAEVTVKKLKAWRQSVSDLAGLLEALDRRIDTANRSESATEAVPIIRIQRPGSTRVVAWLTADRAPDAYRSRYLEQLHAQQRDLATISTRMLSAAWADVEVNQRRAEGLRRLYEGRPAPAELRRAELKLAAVRAENKLAEAVERRHQIEVADLARLLTNQPLPTEAAQQESHDSSTPGRANVQLVSVRQADSDTSFIDSRSHDRLRELACSVAVAEARAEGELRAAEIALARRHLRLEALRKLRQDGFASAAETSAAERQYEAARQLVQRIRDRRRGLRQDHLTMKSSSPKTARAAKYQFVSLARKKQSDWRDVNAVLDAVPAALLNDRAVVRYLTELYWQMCEADATRRAVAAELDMHAEVYRKLSKIDRDGRANPRELELAALDVQFDRARLQAAAERLEILSLEQQRFVCQLEHQVGPSDDQGRITLLAYAEPSGIEIMRKASVVGAAYSTYDWRAAVALGRPPSHLCEAGIVPLPAVRRARTARSRVSGIYFEPDRFRMDPRLLASLSRVHPYPTLRTLDAAHRSCAGDALFVRRTIFNESYSSCYAFGIRRIHVDGQQVWRRRFNSIGGPSYIPGSPTNYR